MNLTFTWTFAGKSCLQTLEVTKVVITLKTSAGVLVHLPNDGYYPCNNGAIDGMRLTNFRPDSYDWALDAVDFSGKVVYSATGKVDALLNASVVADLAAK